MKYLRRLNSNLAQEQRELKRAESDLKLGLAKLAEVERLLSQCKNEDVARMLRGHRADLWSDNTIDRKDVQGLKADIKTCQENIADLKKKRKDKRHA